MTKCRGCSEAKWSAWDSTQLVFLGTKSVTTKIGETQLTDRSTESIFRKSGNFGGWFHTCVTVS